MVPEPLHRGFVEFPRSASAGGSSLDPDGLDFRMLRAKGRPDIRLALRPACPSDGDALQSYFRGLTVQSRYNRILGAANGLPVLELARALAANGRDTMSLLVTSTAGDRETVVGEARVALSCADRAGEFSMSIADDWQGFGVGSALLEEIERKAAADGIESLFGDTLRTNQGMIALARCRGYRLGMGLEARLVRIQKRLEDPAPDLPCRKWNENAGGPERPTRDAWG
jgi:GNAT superfamily N-acetyltransferase